MAAIFVLLLLFSFFGLLVLKVAHRFGWIAGSLVAVAGGVWLFRQWKGQVGNILALQEGHGADDALELGDFEGAERILRSALQKVSSEQGGRAEIQLHWRLAQLLRQLERWDEAIDEVRSAWEAARLKRQNRAFAECARSALMDLLAQQQRWGEIEELIRSDLEAPNGSDDPALHEQLGSALLQQNKTEEALQHLREVVRLCRAGDKHGSHSLVYALRGLGQAALDHGHLPEASVAFEELHRCATVLHEPDSSAWTLVSIIGQTQALLASNETDRALALLESAEDRVISADIPDLRAEYHLQFARVLLNLSRQGEAKAHTERAREIREVVGEARRPVEMEDELPG